MAEKPKDTRMHIRVSVREKNGDLVHVWEQHVPEIYHDICLWLRCVTTKGTIAAALLEGHSVTIERKP